MVAIGLGSLTKRRSKTSMLYYVPLVSVGKMWSAHDWAQRWVSVSAAGHLHNSDPNQSRWSFFGRKREFIFFSSPSPILNQLTSHVLFQVNIYLWWSRLLFDNWLRLVWFLEVCKCDTWWQYHIWNIRVGRVYNISLNKTTAYKSCMHVFRAELLLNPWKSIN